MSDHRHESVVTGSRWRLPRVSPAWLRLRRRRIGEPPARPAGTRLAGILRAPRLAALVTIAVLVAAASLTSFAESYRGLYDWAREHGLHGVWAAVWPLQIDVFIAVGELALFIALVDAWNRRSRAGAWTVTLLGLAVSVAGNVGHVAGHSLTNRATAAIPPLAAAAALAVGLGVLKRVVEHHHHAAISEQESTVVTAPVITPGPLPESANGGNGRAHPVSTPARSRDRSRRAPAKRAPAAPPSTEQAEHEFRSEIASGAVPSLRAIRSRMHVGPDRAKVLHDHLASVIAQA